MKYIHYELSNLIGQFERTIVQIIVDTVYVTLTLAFSN